MNLQGIISRVQSQFGDTTGVQISTAEITQWANDGQVDINRKTEYLKGSENIDAVAGTYAYALPSGSILVSRVEHDGLKLEQVNFEDFDQIYSGKRSESSGTPKHWYLWGTTLNIAPTPDTALSGGISVYYVKRPAILINYSDIPELPEEYHEDIVRYCLIRAKEKDEEYAEANNLRNDYDQRLFQSKYDEQNRENSSFPAVRILPGDD